MQDETATSAIATAPETIDWRAVADTRLVRLVVLEHDCSILRDRINALQVEYRELLVAGDDQSQRIRELDRDRVTLAHRLHDLAREHAEMQAAFLGSRSWRLTRPLRSLSTALAGGRSGMDNLLRAMLRVPWLRRVSGTVARMVPGLHQRLRARLYPRG